MKKIKKIIATLKRKMLFFSSILSEKKYVKDVNKYLKYIGCDISGIVKFCARDVKIDFTEPSRIHIGNNTVITSKVTILVHDYSVECGLVTIGKEDSIYESLFIKDVYIGDNCFIGQSSFIKPGTIIGNNCIVGSGSVLGGKYPDNSIIIGNPAIVIAKTDEWAWKKYNEHSYINGNKRK